MGWTAGQLDGPFNARAAIAFACGEQFAECVIETALKGRVVYAAVRTRNSKAIFGLVVLTERVRGTLYTKPVSEDMGPAESDCPARILDLLSAPSNDYATEWRARCRARLARRRPRSGETVVFAAPIEFTDGKRHQGLTFCGGSRFTSADGDLYYVTKWSQLDYEVEPVVAA